MLWVQSISSSRGAALQQVTVRSSLFCAVIHIKIDSEQSTEDGPEPLNRQCIGQHDTVTAVKPVCTVQDQRCQEYKKRALYAASQRCVQPLGTKQSGAVQLLAGAVAADAAGGSLRPHNTWQTLLSLLMLHTVTR